MYFQVSDNCVKPRAAENVAEELKDFRDSHLNPLERTLGKVFRGRYRPPVIARELARDIRRIGKTRQSLQVRHLGEQSGERDDPSSPSDFPSAPHPRAGAHRNPGARKKRERRASSRAADRPFHPDSLLAPLLQQSSHSLGKTSRSLTQAHFFHKRLA